MVLLSLGAPVCQVQVEARLERKSSQPLFMALTGPAGCARVVVETWPDFFGVAVLARVVFVDAPTVGGVESTTMPIFCECWTLVG